MTSRSGCARRSHASSPATRRDDAMPASAFDHRAALTREVLKSERTRARALAIILSLLLLLSVAFFLAPLLKQSFPQARIVTLLSVFTPFIVYELIVMRVIDRRLAKGRDV